MDRDRGTARPGRRDASTVVVTNEVGWGIVPVNEPARTHRETLDRVNRVVAGRGLEPHEMAP